MVGSLQFLTVFAVSTWTLVETQTEGNAESSHDNDRARNEEYLEGAVGRGNGTLGDSRMSEGATLGAEDFVALFLILLCMAFVSMRQAHYRCERRKFKKNLSANPRQHQSRSAFLRRPPRSRDDLFGQQRHYPAPSSSTFQMRYSMRSRLRLYRSITGTVIARTGHISLLVGLFAGCITWWMSLAEDLHTVTGAGWLSAESVYANAKSCQDIHQMMLPLVTFILAIYVNRRLNWWFGIMTLVWTVQGKLHDLALIVGGGLIGNEPGRAAIKWRIYRYLNLAHFCLYARLCDRFSGFTEMDLIKAGFLTESEAHVLTKDSCNKKNTVFLWLSHIVQGLIRDGVLVSEVSINLVDSLKDLRGASSMLTKEMSRVPPFSWAQLLQMMVDALLLLTPPALSYAFRTDHMGWGKYVWPSVGSFVIALFFQGWLELVNIMEDPFGDDLDDLNLDWVLISSECAIFGYLSDPLPLDGLEMSCYGSDSLAVSTRDNNARVISSELLGASARDQRATAFSTQRESQASDEASNPLLADEDAAGVGSLRVAETMYATNFASVNPPQPDRVQQHSASSVAPPPDEHLAQHTVLLSRIVQLLEASATAQAIQGQPVDVGLSKVLPIESAGRPVSPDKSFRMVPSPRVSLSDPNFGVASITIDGQSTAACPAAQGPAGQTSSWSPSPMQVAQQNGSNSSTKEAADAVTAEKNRWSWGSGIASLLDVSTRSAPAGSSASRTDAQQSPTKPQTHEPLSTTQPCQA